MTQLIVIGVLLLVMEKCYFRIAQTLNITDKPNLRSSHKIATINGGGIVFLIGMWLFAAMYGTQYQWFIAGLSLIGGISFLDDLRPLPVRFRLLVHCIAMFFLIKQLAIFNLLEWWMIPIGLIAGVGITNACNFMDGINGMTAANSLAVLLPLNFLNHQFEFISPHLLIIATISVLIFAFFNFRKKAVCFAGDVGSITIAFILFFAISQLILKTHNFAYLGLLIVYIADSGMTILHRIKLGENLGVAHRKHAYQIMANELRMPHRAVSAAYFIAQTAISVGLITMQSNQSLYLIAVAAALAIGYVLFMKRYFYLHVQYLESRTGAAEPVPTFPSWEGERTTASSRSEG